MTIAPPAHADWLLPIGGASVRSPRGTVNSTRESRTPSRGQTGGTRRRGDPPLTEDAAVATM